MCELLLCLKFTAAVRKVWFASILLYIILSFECVEGKQHGHWDKEFPRIVFLRLSLFKPSWVVVDVTLSFVFYTPEAVVTRITFVQNNFCVPWLGCRLVVTSSYLEAAHKITKTFKLCPWKLIAYLKNKVNKKIKKHSQFECVFVVFQKCGLHKHLQTPCHQEVRHQFTIQGKRYTR